MLSEFERLTTLHETATKEIGQSEAGLTKEGQEERLIRSIADLHEKALKEILKFTQERATISPSETRDLALRVSTMWKDLAYVLSGVQRERIDDVLQQMGIQEKS